MTARVRRGGPGTRCYLTPLPRRSAVRDFSDIYAPPTRINCAGRCRKTQRPKDTATRYYDANERAARGPVVWDVRARARARRRIARGGERSSDSRKGYLRALPHPVMITESGTRTQNGVESDCRDRMKRASERARGSATDSAARIEMHTRVSSLTSRR